MDRSLIAPAASQQAAAYPDYLLLVEDDEGLAELFLQCLEKETLPVERVSTGAAALARLEQRPNALLLLDYSLPDMKATEMVEALAQIGRVPPFLVITGQGDERLAVNFMKLGALDYLVKDTLLLERLPSIVSRLLGELEVRRRLSISERELRENQAQLAAIFDHTPTVLLLLDQEQRIHRVNRAAAEMAHKPIASITGLRLGVTFGCAHDAEAPDGCGHSDACNACVLRRSVQQAFESGSSQRMTEARLRWCPELAEPERIYLIATLPLTIGGERFVLASLEDITALRKAEADRARWFELLNASINELYIFNLDPLRFRFVNLGALRNLGYTAEQICQMGPLDLMNKADPSSFEQLIAPLRSREKSEVVFSTIHRRADGTTYPIEGRLQLFEHEGEPVVLAVLQDVTLRRQLEDHLRQAQKMEAVGQLAGGVAHDFNNILTAMMMNLNLLQATPNLSDEDYEVLKELETDARRAAGLTQQLLAFSRRQMMQIRTIDLNDVVLNLSKMLRRLLGEHIQLTVSAHSGPAWTKADSGMIEQAITNLCVNARDAMPQGGALTLTIEPAIVTEEQAQKNADARPGSFVRVAVKDTGCGMDATLMSHIFEPFFTTKDVGKGTGLGLSTVYGIVRQHLGWVEVQSQLRQGSTFFLYFPVSHAPVKVSDNLRTALSMRGSETILLVEDETNVRNKAAECLESMGYQVLKAAHGVEALRLWENHNGQVDLLLTDIMMPEGISGVELSTRLRQIKKNLKVILTSGYNLELTRPETLREKGAHFLQKPYGSEALALAVRRCLEETS